MLVYIVVALFLALLFLNFYFKREILRHYKVLVKNRVEFGVSHIFSPKKMEEEVLGKYPACREDILAFSAKIRKSLLMAAGLILAIALLSFIIVKLKNP